MATINSAFLALQPESNNQATVLVICDISIPASENQSAFRLDCTIFGNDLLRDDFLFSYETQLFFGADLGPSRRFEKRVSLSLLNEDIVGRDEVIGKVTLKNVTQNKVVKRNTSVVEVVS